MDPNGQVYFGFEDDIPGADKKRYEDAVSKEEWERLRGEFDKLKEIKADDER